MLDFFEFFIDVLPQFYQGTLITIQLTLVGLGIGFMVGLPAAIARVYGGRWLRRISLGYIELFRGTPLLVQLFVIYFGFPDFGLTLSRMLAAYLAMGLNSGAYQAEYFRSGIQSVGEGQMRAARAVGMSRLQAIRYIILPQMLRTIIPAWSNEPILLMKASAVAFLIAVPDLMGKAKSVVAATYNPIPTYVVVAIIYFVLVVVLSLILQYVERRLRIPGLELEVRGR